LRRSTAKLALEDGTVLRGEHIGAAGTSVGEVVFNTSLSGYQEIFTDPSYNGQMVVMTNPLIGNYGVNVIDEESAKPHVRGVIVRELSRRTSNLRATEDLGSYLERHGIVGISGVDTRAVTKLLRVGGAMKGVIASGDDGSADFEDRRLVQLAKDWPGLQGVDMVREVSCKTRYEWTRGFESEFSSCFRANRAPNRPGRGYRIVAYDFGIKFNILRLLKETGFDVVVLPATATAAEARAEKPHGVFLSNGPGDPEGLPYAVEAVRDLIRDYPTFGICLGHQLTALALGGRTYKLKFGHHGGNHPVQDLRTGKVEISVQNHCYAVDESSLGPDVESSFVNLNDRSNEGLTHKRLPLFTVQFHPEAAPGPNDFTSLFDRFADLVKKHAS
jgi:carbamoyl-phosphate synthase small subunit